MISFFITIKMYLFYYSSYEFDNSHEKNNITMLTSNKLFPSDLNTFKYFNLFTICSTKKTDFERFFISIRKY
jgi:hypothetical protein